MVVNITPITSNIAVAQREVVDVTFQSESRRHEC